MCNLIKTISVITLAPTWRENLKSGVGKCWIRKLFFMESEDTSEDLGWPCIWINYQLTLSVPFYRYQLLNLSLSKYFNRSYHWELFQIDQKVDEPWPLTVINHLGEKKKIFLKPGEMLLYESAKMPHGRQFPLIGDYYDNLFVHYRFKNHNFLYDKNDTL